MKIRFHKKQTRPVAGNKMTYTKKAVKALLIVGVINAEVPYILAAFGRESVSALGIVWVSEIIAVITGYMCKAYFETKESEKVRLKEREMDEKLNKDADDVGEVINDDIDGGGVG